MTIEAVTDLLNVLAWPVVILIALGIFRRELTGLFGRVREIEGPGDLKLSLDPSKVRDIIEQGRQENAPPSAVAQRIVRSAVVLDRREARILRALLDDDGRAIYSYQSDYYKTALDGLLKKELVRKVDKGFRLSAEGRRVTKEYLLPILQQLDTDSPQETARRENVRETSSGSLSGLRN
jgi:hypothetical protein